MRIGILKNYERKLARGAAILFVGGMAAGCSSQVDRFSDGLFTGSASPRQQRSASLAQQPYPGDAGYANSSLDRTPTGSVGDRVVRPEMPVGGGSVATGNREYVPANSGGSAMAAPVGGVQRGSISSAPLAPVSSASAQSRLAPVSAPANGEMRQAASASHGGWSGQNGAKVTVRQGETVYNLSKRFGVPANAILAANGLNGASSLQAGQTIVIPTYAYSEKASPSEPDADSRVAKAAAAPHSGGAGGTPSQKTRGDQVAVLPRNEEQAGRQAASPDRNDDTTAATGSASSGNSYTVASGDTLYGISKKTGASVAALKEANGLENGYLRVGQQLKVTAPGDKPSQVAAAKQDAIDTVKTATVDTSKHTAADGDKVSSYTPPSKAAGADKSSSVADQAQDDEEASLPPDSTGIGHLRWPVRGRILSAFGSGGAAGDGIDIAVPEGTPIKAAENGVVIYAGNGLKEFGKTVLVRHEDGLVTVYGYASEIKVDRGATVKRGQVIALSGMTGSADRPKVHFEVRKDAAPVNPTKFLD